MTKATARPMMEPRTTEMIARAEPHAKVFLTAMTIAIVIQIVAAKNAALPTSGIGDNSIMSPGEEVKPTLRMNCRNVPPMNPGADVPVTADTIRYVKSADRTQPSNAHVAGEMNSAKGPLVSSA